ncbi:hypothetical protein ACFOLC_10080 [Lysobacter cavernae]|uniref:Uncharacterized protein n=1 Tax=Lysobacter cavernae TaxID=1685901 RepID=A0ABV7RRK1_9GAMM
MNDQQHTAPHGFKVQDLSRRIVYTQAAGDTSASQPLRQQRLDALQTHLRRQAALRPAALIQSQRRALAELLERYPDLGAERERMAPAIAALSEWRQEAIAYTPPYLRFPEGGPVLISPDTTFDYLGTSTFCCSPQIGIDVVGDELRLFGHIRYTQDPLFSCSAGGFDDYGLPSGRFPLGATRFTVTPSIELVGMVQGSTGYYHPLWGADDKWSKCWLVTRVTVLRQPAGQPAQVLNFGEHVVELFKLENEFIVGCADAVLEGCRVMPRVDFDLPDRNASLLVQLEVRFDFQLEGDGTLCLHGGGDAPPSVDNAIRWRTYPFNLIPLW